MIPGIGPIAGAGLGALAGGIGNALTPNDPRYSAQQGYLQQLQGIGAPRTAGIDPLSQQAFGLYQKLATSGPNISQFYDPYQGQVIAGANRDIADARTSALNAAADTATREGAFGGSRSGLMGATALGNVNRAGLSTLAGLRSSGFAQALQAAQAQQGFGLQAAQALQGAGDYSRSVTQAGYDAPFNRLEAMGPLYAQQLYAGQSYQPKPPWWQSAIGGGLAGFGLFNKKPMAPNVQSTERSVPGVMQPYTSFPSYGQH
jgi:hypothetical protein